MMHNYFDELLERNTELSAKVSALQAQLDELTPWALAGALAHMDDDPSICACVEVRGKFVILHPHTARELADRLEFNNG